MITKPMLASNCGDSAALKYPLLATPKLDGFRCLKLGRALTRAFKPIPNRYVREWIEANVPDGCDGELIVKGATFSESASALASRDGEPDFEFHVFDHVLHGEISEPYADRMKRLCYLPLPERCVRVLPAQVDNAAELAGFEARCLMEGYEGVMVRTPLSPYKCGRSTEREGYLLKIKRFEDDEAEVLEAVELMRNGNPATTNAIGATQRSSAKAGLTSAGMMGALRCRRLSDGCEFSIGTGFTDAVRMELWTTRGSLPGRVVKFRHQPSGAKDAPRFPAFVAFREAWDMGQ